ncbi:tetratricopeptide repeat protein [Desulfovibrio sp. TomC]|uniref:tetratricopeptide repeat protein n=1 Tax=Desulfovibrio sp. TomC TaxID=1562888 RepID=UPI0005740793|nr:tetratricopeptide repeat protein [Desulfovibrio sp. TomC]KHK01153.1 hypothetical protein NY78_3346 [Desulfovibrio sp. TomC]
MHHAMGRFAKGLAVVLAAAVIGAGPVRAASLGSLSAANDTVYQSAVAASDALDYPTALAYLTQSLTTNPDNGEAYLTRAGIDLVLDVPSQAVSDASKAVSLLRAADTCDQYLPTDSPLLAVAGTSIYSSYPYSSSLYGAGSILNGSSLYSSTNVLSGTTTGSTTGTSTGTGATSSTSGSTTGTTTTGTTSGTTTTGATTGTTTSGTSTTASSSQFSSSEGSQHLPVAEDLTDKDKKKNETMNEYNTTMTKVAMASAYCGGTYLKNMDKLVLGYTLLGDAYLAQGNYSNAQLAYNAALELDENNAKATGGLGLTYIGLGAGTAALSTLNLAVTYDPTLPNVYVDRASYWVSIGDPGRALEDDTTALSLDAGYARAYDAIGRLRYDAGSYQAAITEYDKALALQPSYVAALKHRAKAWQALAAADPAQAATYNQNAQNDLDKASSLQQLVTTSSSATSTSTSSLYSSSLTTAGTTTTLPSSLDSGIR